MRPNIFISFMLLVLDFIYTVRKCEKKNLHISSHKTYSKCFDQVSTVTSTGHAVYWAEREVQHSLQKLIRYLHYKGHAYRY